MTYGMPYKGSKNKIAKKLIEQMPSADYFVDLFGGGWSHVRLCCSIGQIQAYHIQ